MLNFPPIAADMSAGLILFSFPSSEVCTGAVTLEKLYSCGQKVPWVHTCFFLQTEQIQCSRGCSTNTFASCYFFFNYSVFFFPKIFNISFNSQGTEIFKEHSPHTMSPMSYVTCCLSNFKSFASHVTFHMTNVIS